jgi:ribosomal protein S5
MVKMYASQRIFIFEVKMVVGDDSISISLGDEREQSLAIYGF